MPTILKHLLTLVVALFIAVGPVEVPLDEGSLAGTIRDERGVVSEASVAARNLMTGGVTHAKSAADGRYEIGGLPRGRYSLWVEARGHSSMWLYRILVERGKPTQQDVTLQRAERPWGGVAVIELPRQVDEIEIVDDGGHGRLLDGGRAKAPATDGLH